MQYLMPFMEKEKYELPSKCRLHPDNDMFREQEQHKIHFDINEWRCGFCKKAFRAEKFLDQHFENRHNNLLDNVCLLNSNYCWTKDKGSHPSHYNTWVLWSGWLGGAL